MVGATIASVGHHVATEHLLPAASSLAGASLEHGVPAARAALSGLSYRGSDAFHSLVDRIKSLPEVPSLEMQHFSGHTGDTLAPYAPITRKRRSASPSTSAYVSRPTLASARSAPTTQMPSNYVSFDTADAWRAHSQGLGVLGSQLMLRPQFLSVQKTGASRGENISQNGSRNTTAKYMKGLNSDDMIQLLLMLDGRH